MGDARRFGLLADLVAERFPERSLPIADVAAGKGHLKAALYLRGYRRVTAWDKRHKLAKRRPGQKYQLFDYRTAPRGYRLVLGMHPDGATDQIVMYALKHRVPFVVCPCCVIPTASDYAGPNVYDRWMRHLVELGRGGGFTVETLSLPMEGRSRVLLGRPR